MLELDKVNFKTFGLLVSDQLQASTTLEPMKMPQNSIFKPFSSQLSRKLPLHKIFQKQILEFLLKYSAALPRIDYLLLMCLKPSDPKPTTHRKILADIRQF